jgi:tRNA threonylcarbamoyladenosine biosynthesis protein TsaB
MAFAKGFAFAHSRPLVSVPSLDMYAFGREFFPGPVFPVIDARKNRIYTAAFRDGFRTGDYLDIYPDSLASHLPEEECSLLTGPFAPQIHARCRTETAGSRGCLLLDRLALEPRGRALAELALQRYNERGADDESTGPLYIRPSEAELSASKDEAGGSW